MGKQFKSVAEIEQYARNKVEDALDDTYDELLDKLIQIIDRDVYRTATRDSNEPFYERQYDLLERKNWEIVRTKYGKKVTRNLYFKGECLSTPSGNGYGDPSSFVHGNPFEEFEPNNFLRMLNNEIEQGDAFNFPHVNRRSFWDDFMNYVDKNFNKIFAKHCKANGLPTDISIKY